MTTGKDASAAHEPSGTERTRTTADLTAGASCVRLSTNMFALRTSDVERARKEAEERKAPPYRARPLPYVAPQQLPQPTETAEELPRDGWFTVTVAWLAGAPDAVRRAMCGDALPTLLLPVPSRHPLSIGRAPGSMLRLVHGSVSRAHARLRSTPGYWSVRDLGSSNGTWVNGARITSPVGVRPGDRVWFGDVGFLLADPAQQDRGPAGRA